MQKKSDIEYIKNLRRTIRSLKDKSKSLCVGVSMTSRTIGEIDAETDINVNTTMGSNTIDKEKGINVSSSMVRHYGYSIMTDSDDDKRDEMASEPFPG